MKRPLAAGGEGSKDKGALKPRHVFAQSPQEKRKREASRPAEAVGLVPGSGAGDVSAVEGGHRTVGEDGPRRAERYAR